MHSTRRLSTTAIVASLLLVVTTAGCGDTSGGDGGGANGGGTPSLKDQTLQGSIRGSDWTFTAGEAEVSDGTIQLELYAGPSDACSFDKASYDNWQLLTRNVPNEETRSNWANPLQSGGDGPSLTIAKAPDNIVVVDGFVEITSISDTTIEGSLVGSTDDSTVNGNFTATRCGNQGSGSGSSGSNGSGSSS